MLWASCFSQIPSAHQEGIWVWFSKWWDTTGSKSHQTPNLWCLAPIICVGVLHFLSHKHWELVRSKEEQAGASWCPYYFLSLFFLHWFVCFFTEDPVSPQTEELHKFNHLKRRNKRLETSRLLNTPWKCRLIPLIQRAGSRSHSSCGLPSLELCSCRVNGNLLSRCYVDLLSLVWSLWELGNQGPGVGWPWSTTKWASI